MFNDEPARLAAVRRYDILDTPPDGAFDRITAMAARRFGVPIAIISIVDQDRIWFKSRYGVEVDEIGRDPGLCASAILSEEAHVLTDASTDPRSLSNPLVAGDLGLRFYAGVPLRTGDGHNLGTLCVIDREARPISQAELDDLTDLAALVMDQLELRLSARKAVAQAELLAREIDHRVMNSLQFISAFLTMQSRQSDASATVDQLQAAANRVAAVARVHHHFISPDATERVSCLGFLRGLCADLSGIIGQPIHVHGDEGDVPTSQIQPIGLIANELVTNAAKHGAGKIEVIYRIEDGVHEIAVCDEGEGLSPDFDPAKCETSLGMTVVTTLVNQLGGRITTKVWANDKGLCFIVNFPA